MGEPTEARCRLYTALDSCRRHKQQGRDAACCSIAAFYRMRFQSSLGNLDYAKEIPTRIFKRNKSSVFSISTRIASGAGLYQPLHLDLSALSV